MYVQLKMHTCISAENAYRSMRRSTCIFTWKCTSFHITIWFSVENACRSMEHHAFLAENAIRPQDYARPAENAYRSIERHAGCPWGLDRLSSPGARDEESIWYAAREIRLPVAHRRRDARSILFWSVCLQHFTAQAGFSTANCFTTSNVRSNDMHFQLFVHIAI